MKRKNPGISLLISMGVSFLVLGIAAASIASINRAVQRSSDLGRANQVFFAAESGLEAAFFHHNSRGQGTHFSGDSVDAQEIAHTNAFADVYWKIEGREKVVSGLLEERQKIQIPLFWDSATNPGQKSSFEEGGVFEELGGTFDLAFSLEGIPDNFPFGDSSSDDSILIDWAVSREHVDGSIQTFVPLRGGSCTSGTTAFVCRNDFLDGGITIATEAPGEILPGGETITLDDFLDVDETVYGKFILSFQAMLPFENMENGEVVEKIEGIPFSVEDAGATILLPKETYNAIAEVSIGNFSRIITAEVPEKTTIGAFDYVIFD